MNSSSIKRTAVGCLATGLIAGTFVMPAQASSASQTSSRSGYTLTHLSTIMSGDGEGGAEISAYDAQTNSVVATNGVDFTLDIYSLANISSPVKTASVALASYGATVTSVSAKNGIAVVAVPGAVTNDANTGVATIAQGKVVIVDIATGTVLDDATVGYLPDGVAISSDGRTAVIANEAEPSCATNVSATVANESTDLSLINDPVGTVSLVDLTTPSNITVREVNFNGITRSSAIARGLLVRANATPAQDFEPEFVTISADNATAFVTLQENNGLAVVDIASGTLKRVSSVGTIDRSQVPLDPSDRDSAKSPTQKFDNVFSLRMPDAIANFTSNGNTFLVSADEGDAREYTCLSDDVRAKDLTGDATAFANWAATKADAVLGRAKTNPGAGDTDGDGDYDAIYLRGGRSMTVYDKNGNAVADTGAQIEQWFAQYNLAGFNGQYNTANSVTTYAADDRSDDKGAEPEGVAVGTVGDATLAFVGLERANALAIVDVTNPVNPTVDDIVGFDGYTYSGAATGLTRWSPEGIVFVPAATSPTGKALVITSFEMSGSLSIDEISPKSIAPQVAGSQIDNQLRITVSSVKFGKRTYNVNLLNAYKGKKATLRVLRNGSVVRTIGVKTLNTNGNSSFKSNYTIAIGDVIQVLTNGRVRGSLTVR